LNQRRRKVPKHKSTRMLRLIKMTYIDGSEVACCSVPDGEDNPLPKDLEVEVGAFLAGLVDLRVLVNVLVVDVLLDGIGEEASPGGPKGVVEGLEPVGEEDLA